MSYDALAYCSNTCFTMHFKIYKKQIINIAEGHRKATVNGITTISTGTAQQMFNVASLYTHTWAGSN